MEFEARKREIEALRVGIWECGVLSKEISKPLRRKGNGTQRKPRKHSMSRKAFLDLGLGSEEGIETRKRKLLWALELRKLANSSGLHEGSSSNSYIRWGFSGE